MYVLKDDHLAQVNLLPCMLFLVEGHLSPYKVAHIVRFAQLPIVLCVGLATQGLFSNLLVLSISVILFQLTFGQLCWRDFMGVLGK